MTAHLPKPLTPPDSCVAHLPSMLLDVQRLRDSGVANHENPEVFRASVLLWCASWQQTPAASLDNKDRELAGMAGFSRAMGEWLKIKDEVMSGFVLCADGRWYHPVVAEKALEQLLERLTLKAAGAKGNASQGKTLSGGRDLTAQMADLAIRLSALNPQASVLNKPAVVEALAIWGSTDAESSGTKTEPDAPSVPSDGRTAPAARTQGDTEGDGVRSHGERTASAVPTHGERGADAKEENRILSPLPPLEGGDAEHGNRFQEAFDAYPAIGQTKFAQAEAAWPDVAAEAGGEEQLIEAVKAFSRSSAAKAREGRGVPSILTWLRRGDWKAYAKQGDHGVERGPSTWAGPEDIRADVVAHIADSRGGDAEAGEKFAISYLDVCAWRDLPERAVVCRNATIHQRLKAQCGALFKRLGVGLVHEAMEAAA